MSRFTSLRTAVTRGAGLGGCPTGPPVGGVTSTSTPALWPCTFCSDRPLVIATTHANSGKRVVAEKPRVALQHNRNVVSVKHTASKASNHCAAKQACKSCVILGNYDDLIISLTHNLSTLTLLVKGCTFNIVATLAVPTPRKASLSNNRIDIECKIIIISEKTITS